MKFSLKNISNKLKEYSENRQKRFILKTKMFRDKMDESIARRDMDMFYDTIKDNPYEDIHYDDEHLLNFAVYTNNIEVVKFILLNKGDAREHVNLVDAVGNWNAEMVKLLVKYGAIIRHDSIMRAVEIDDVDILKFLVQKSVTHKLTKKNILNSIVKFALEEEKKNTIDYLEDEMKISDKKAIYKWENSYENDLFSEFRIREASKVYKIQGYGNRPVSQLVRELCKKIYKNGVPSGCVNVDSITGDRVEEIPPGYLYVFNQDWQKYCEDIRAMIKIKKNPYTGRFLDTSIVNDVVLKFNLLN